MDNPRIEDLRRRVEQDPASIAFAQLAEEYRRAANYEDAVVVCRAGLDVHPGYLSARVTLGRALLELGVLDEAKVELELVLKSAPDNLAARRGLAEIHHKRGALSEALTQYEIALGLARNDPDLEETVSDLTRRLASSRAPEKDSMSFEQMKRDLTIGTPEAPGVAVVPQIGTPLAAPAGAAAVQSSMSAVPSAERPGREQGVKTIAALEEWLDAIHASRTDRRA